MAMTRRMLVTAGSTAMMIDQVRKISNIFRGRTGWNIASHASTQGWMVTLLTSERPSREQLRPYSNLSVRHYRTFDDLAELMEEEIRHRTPEAIIHSAAVSDYRPVGLWQLDADRQLKGVTRTGQVAGKVSSAHERLFLELVPSEKLVDQIRQPWGFDGVLVKFKLQVDMSDQELLAIANRSRQHSDADLMVANCLEWASAYAYIIDRSGEAVRVERPNLPVKLLEYIDA